jgi:(p)ppGpp synthase/HD superfamily hydrolase
MPDVRAAEAFARGAHAGQKHGDRQYWRHLQAVANGLIGWGYDDNSPVVSAAWLHDTIEDTKVTYQEIKWFFGIEVAEIVWNVTDEMGRNRKERKEKTSPKIFSTPESTALKLSDLCDNVLSSARYKDRHLDMYIAEWPEIHRVFLDGIIKNYLPLVVELEKLDMVINEACK